MSKIAQRLRKARETRIEAAGFTFIVRRPTDIEMIELRGGFVQGEKLLRFLVGWEGVKESDVVDGGDPHDLKFDPEDAREWLTDRPDLFAAITTGLLEKYAAHEKELEERLKNSTPGSNRPPSDSSQELSPTTPA